MLVFSLSHSAYLTLPPSTSLTLPPSFCLSHSISLTPSLSLCHPLPLPLFIPHSISSLPLCLTHYASLYLSHSTSLLCPPYSAFLALPLSPCLPHSASLTLAPSTSPSPHLSLHHCYFTSLPSHFTSQLNRSQNPFYLCHSTPFC